MTKTPDIPQEGEPLFGAPRSGPMTLGNHVRALGQLAAPVVMTRLGLMGLSIVDTAMVGHYATPHLAWLNLANQSVIMFTLVIGLGLLMGVLIFTASAFGEGDMAGCGRVWRRTLPYTTLISIVLLAACWPAEYWLTLLGQIPQDAARAGQLIQILALGLPGHFLFLQSTMFLEGIKRPTASMRVMGIANLVNILANALLIYGLWGAPELGAEGSAWASTAVRWVMGGGMALYIWFSPTMADYAVRVPVAERWADWRPQRMLGYASAVSLAAEVAAFGGLAIYAGWLGTIPLAAHGVMFQITGAALMISIGIGVASSVRVGIAASQTHSLDVRRAVLTGLGLTVAVNLGFMAAILAFAPLLLRLFSNDIAVISLLEPLAVLFSLSMLFDGIQMVISNILRGLKETWWPTALTITAFVGIMLPASYGLAFIWGLGFEGLIAGTITGCIASFFLQYGRWMWLRARLDTGTGMDSDSGTKSTPAPGG